MPLAWITLRHIPHRPLAAIVLVSVIAISLRALVHSRPLRASDPSFRLVLADVHPGVGVLVESDLEWAPEGEHTQVDDLHPGKHVVNPDGLLVVNPDGPHPIFQLIHDAEAAWEAKHARSSKTLQEAVAEYRRRYRRAPPLGFDKWWNYVVKHRVLLPDEYDEIFEDIEPFWGIGPQELERTRLELEIHDNVVTVEKTDARSRLEVVRSTLPKERERELQGAIDRILALIRDVEHELPPLRMTLSPYDNPGMFSDWQIKSMALEAAANGTTLTREDLPSVEQGWIQACPPDSPARLHPPDYPPSTTLLPPLSLPKTFIASHRDAMNPCMHPSLLTTHGQFLSYKTGPFPKRTLVPRFSLCATVLHHDIRPPVPYGWAFDADSEPDDEDDEGSGAFEGDVPWEDKVNEKLGWRGRTTGMWASPDTWWANGQRARLVSLANAPDGEISVLPVPTNKSGRGVESWAEANPVGEAESMPIALANSAWMDVAFADRPIACDKDSGTCDEMERRWNFLEMQNRHKEGQYKFILDVDGNGWSGRFKRLMTSNALVFKATVYPEWYTSRIAPWVHYVPIQMSYVDLYDAVSFFRVHDAMGRRIARAGRAWSRRYWRKEDMTAYLYRLLLEYARVMSLDRGAMDYVG